MRHKDGMHWAELLEGTVLYAISEVIAASPADTCVGVARPTKHWSLVNAAQDWLQDSSTCPLSIAELCVQPGYDTLPATLPPARSEPPQEKGLVQRLSMGDHRQITSMRGIKFSERPLDHTWSSIRTWSILIPTASDHDREATVLELSVRDRAMLSGELGDGAALAMRIVVATAHVMNAQRLVDISSAHIDGCLYHGSVSLDFVERFVASGTRVAVPTTLNVGSLDLIHPELYRGKPETANAAKRLMEAHLELGCEATFTCAPYQLKHRPRLGDQIAWAESNAIVFANSVLGARTSRYGDFLDLAAAITGRVPYAGLHVTENRAARLVLAAPSLRDSSRRDACFAALGFLLGLKAGATVAAITGLPADTTEDELKSLGAAAASSGSVALFHAVGITPEASTLDAALQGGEPEQTIIVSEADLVAIHRKWNDARSGEPLAAISLGTPHFSIDEFRRLAKLFDSHKGPLQCDFYVNTSRFVLWQIEEEGLAQRLASRGVQIVVDTCTYITPVMKQINGLVMTNSGKWAHYAPANIGVTVAFGSMSECVRSAFEGRVCIDELAG